MVAASCVCQGVWLRNVLVHLKVNQKESSLTFCDISFLTKLSKNPSMHVRGKHNDIKFYFLKDHTKDRVIELRHCNTQDHQVDILNNY